MKHLQIYENFITDLFKKKQKSKLHQALYPDNNNFLSVVKIKYQIGEILKRVEDGRLGKVLAHEPGITNDNQLEIVYMIKFGNELNGYFKKDLEVPTEEEKEFFETINKYNL